MIKASSIDITDTLRAQTLNRARSAFTKFSSIVWELEINLQLIHGTLKRIDSDRETNL